jgi:hypothetical protein
LDEAALIRLLAGVLFVAVLAMESIYVYRRGQRSGARGSFWAVWSAGRFDRQPVLPGERLSAFLLMAVIFAVLEIAVQAFFSGRALEHRSDAYFLPIFGAALSFLMVFVIGRAKNSSASSGRIAHSSALHRKGDHSVAPKRYKHR